jgi:hypothetical protein
MIHSAVHANLVRTFTAKRALQHDYFKHYRTET